MSAPKRISSPAHAGPTDPFQFLVEAGADAEKLNRRLAWVAVGMELEKRFRTGRKRRGKLRRAEKARLRRFPARLRTMADDVATLVSRPEVDPRILLSNGHLTQPLSKRLRLKDAVSESQQHATVRDLVDGWLNVPATLCGLAAYLEIALPRRHRTQPTRSDTLRRRAIVALSDYVRNATGHPHYREVADLVNECKVDAGAPSSDPVSAEDIQKLSERNPSLRYSAPLF